MIFENNYHPTLPLPYLYPTPSGGIQAEWHFKDWEISLNIDLYTKTAFYQSFNQKTDTTTESTFDLNKDDGWKNINQSLIAIFKG